VSQWKERSQQKKNKKQRSSYLVTGERRRGGTEIAALRGKRGGMAQKKEKRCQSLGDEGVPWGSDEVPMVSELNRGETRKYYYTQENGNKKQRGPSCFARANK